MKTRAGIKDDASGRATSSTSWPIAGRVTARHLAAARHLRRGVPEGQSAGRPIMPGIIGRSDQRERSELPGYPARAVPPPPFPSLRRSARRVTGATPSGRPGPRAHKQQPQAGAAPTQ